MSLTKSAIFSVMLILIGIVSSAQSLTDKERRELEKRAKDNATAIARNKALNDAFDIGKEALTDASTRYPGESAYEKKVRQISDYNIAIRAFSKASLVDPNQHVIWAELAEAYIGLGNAKTGDDQQAAYDESLKAYAQATALKPDEMAYHNNYALVLVKVKRITEAMAELAKAADLDPPGTEYYYRFGLVLVNVGQDDAAAEAFKKAIGIDPNYADAHYQFAITQMVKATVDKDGKIIPPAGTIEELLKYLKLDPYGQYAEAARGILKSLGIEDAKAARERQTSATCGRVYQATSDKKIKDLTIREEQQVRACQALGLYPPP
jgi:tetratricopeptide (TPR) repeat protein